LLVSDDLEVDDDLFLDGDLLLGGDDADDNDVIYFDTGFNEFLVWDNPNDRFKISNDLNIVGNVDVDGDVNAGGADFDDTVQISAFNSPLTLNKIGGTGGSLIQFYHDGVFVGGISFFGGTVSYNPFTGSHYALTTQEMQRGLLVSMNGQNKHFLDNPEAEILYGVDISTKKNDPAILGTYLGLMESALPQTTENPQLIMSVGNGEIWIADFGQDIKPGDNLISSIIPGHAMVDDNSEQISHIIGRAAESIEWSEVTDTIDGVKHKKISILFNFFSMTNILE